MDLSRFVGVFVDSLSLAERRELAGKWAAYEVYTPKTTPLRRIEALADTQIDCIRQLTASGLDVHRYEFIVLPVPAHI
jgi:hypothetical protein